MYNICYILLYCKITFRCTFTRLNSRIGHFWRILPDFCNRLVTVEEKAAREEAEEEAELVRLSEGWSRARAVELESDLIFFQVDCFFCSLILLLGIGC